MSTMVQVRRGGSPQTLTQPNIGGIVRYRPAEDPLFPIEPRRGFFRS